MSHQHAKTVPGQVIPFDRIPLSDDWLRWDPENIHTYPEPPIRDMPPQEALQGWDDLDPEDLAAPGARAGALPASPRAALPHPAAEIPYYLGLGFAVGLACAAVFFCLAVLFVP